MIMSIDFNLTIEEFKSDLKKIKRDLELLGREFHIDVNEYKRELMKISKGSMSLKEFNDVLNSSWLHLSNNDIKELYECL